MATTSSIFVLKPIIDLLHADVLQYTEQIRVLKAYAEALEKENVMLRETMSKKIKVEQKEEPKVDSKGESKVEPKPVKKAKRKPVIGVIEIKDDDYAKEAETFEPVNVVVVPSLAAVPSVVPLNPDEKVVVLQDEKTRKDYQKEYQRKYRQQKKEKSSK